MGEQNAKNAHTACSPIDVDRPKTKDPNRNPETFVVLPADEQREATIMDCPETTILMRLRQFQHEHLFDLGADLDKYRTAKYVEKVWWSFHQEFEDMPHKEGEKKVGKIKSEKDLTRKWVRGCGAWLRRRQQTANLSSGVGAIGQGRPQEPPVPRPLSSPVREQARRHRRSQVQGRRIVHPKQRPEVDPELPT